MTHLAEAMFWLSLTLLASLGIAASIAYTFIGRSRGLIDAEKTALLASHTRERETVRALIRRDSQLDGEHLAVAGRRLKAHERKLARQIRRLESLDKLLHLRRTVLVPGALLLMAFASSGLGKALTQSWARTFTLAALLSLLAALWLAYRCFLDMAFFTDLLAIKIRVVHECPATWRRGQAARLSLSVHLLGGNSLHSLQTLLFVPPAFTSTAAFNDKLRRGADDPMVPGYNVIPSMDWRVLKRDMAFVYDYDRLACSVAGTYDLYYRVTSEEYTSPYYKYPVTVE